jgi:hypothetical protein
VRGIVCCCPVCHGRGAMRALKLGLSEAVGSGSRRHEGWRMSRTSRGWFTFARACQGCVSAKLHLRCVSVCVASSNNIRSFPSQAGVAGVHAEHLGHSKRRCACSLLSGFRPATISVRRIKQVLPLLSASTGWTEMTPGCRCCSSHQGCVWRVRQLRLLPEEATTSMNSMCCAVVILS